MTVGTLFEDSHIPIRKWLRAFHLMASSKKGISALQLQRNLGLGSYEAAWHLAHRIRRAMQCSPIGEMLSGTVEVDETYVGGKVRGKGYKAGHDNKTPVVSMVERGGEGRKYSVVMRRVNHKSLRKVVMEHVEEGSTINTDELKSYRRLRDKFAHHTVNHSMGQYVRKLHFGRIITTNTVEGSFSLLKRGIVGVFHHVSEKHLHRYTGEFDFRWNHRKLEDVERTRKILVKVPGKRLTYKTLVDKVA